MSTVIQALERRFCAPEWAIFAEVANATGGRKRRSADAVAMNLYPSKGLELWGLEVKVQRSDWLRELKEPDKAAEMIQHMNRWCIVAPSGVVKKDELPAPWGWIQLRTNGEARIAKAPPLINEVGGTVDRGFVAALLRRAHEWGGNESEVGRARKAGYEDGYKEGKSYGDARARRAQELIDSTQVQIKKSIERGLAPLRRLEAKLGFELDGWRPDADVATIKLARTLQLEGLTQFALTARRIADLAQEAAAQVTDLKDAGKQNDASDIA